MYEGSGGITGVLYPVVTLYTDMQSVVEYAVGDWLWLPLAHREWAGKVRTCPQFLSSISANLGKENVLHPYSSNMQFLPWSELINVWTSNSYKPILTHNNQKEQNLSVC